MNKNIPIEAWSKWLLFFPTRNARKWQVTIFLVSLVDCLRSTMHKLKIAKSRPRWDSNSQSSDSKSDALTVGPRGHSTPILDFHPIQNSEVLVLGTRLLSSRIQDFYSMLFLSCRYRSHTKESHKTFRRNMIVIPRDTTLLQVLIPTCPWHLLVNLLVMEEFRVQTAHFHHVFYCHVHPPRTLHQLVQVNLSLVEIIIQPP